jgi:hypothetical protein
MSNRGAVALGHTADRVPMLGVACSKCDWRGLNVAKLIQQHGGDMRLTISERFFAAIVRGNDANSSAHPIDQ